MIKAGTKVTCENGHDIATTLVDLSDGDTTDPNQFEWHVKSPQIGDDVEPCPICGALYIRPNASTPFGELHTTDGWQGFL